MPANSAAYPVLPAAARRGIASTRNVIPARRSGGGFTLIELMIVVVIIAVLAMVAYPAYNRHIDGARRADAKATLMETAHRLERCYTRYFSFLEEDNCDVEFPIASPQGHYEITADEDTFASNQFTLLAAPQGVQERDSEACGVFTLTHRGERGSLGEIGEDANACW